MADNNRNNEEKSRAGISQKIKAPQERRQRRRRPVWLRILRGTGWVLLSLIVAVVIICSAVVWVLSPEQLTPIIERVASRSLNADVKVGRAELTFWSSFPMPPFCSSSWS